MNELKLFENQEFGRIRVVVIDGEPWFVGKDVAESLGYSNPRKALDDHIDLEDKMQGDGVTIRDSIGREQHPTIINRSGVYSLILSSKLPTAKKFKRWVTSEVLPSIERHGLYATEQLLNDPDLAIKAFTALKEEREKRLALEAEVKANAPLVLFAKGVEGSSNSILVRDMAKILNQNGIQIGGNRLFDWLRQNGYLVKQKGRDRNMPTQRSMELGLFEVKETVISHTNGTQTHRTPLITGKGQTYFYNILREWPGLGRQARPV